MSLRTSVGRLGEALRPSAQPSWLTALILLVGIPPVVFLSTELGFLIVGLGLAMALLVTVIGFRWPLLPLAIFVVFVPIEEVVVIEGLGTFSRLAGVLFAVTYGATRLGRLTLGTMPPAAWAYLAWAIVSLGWAIDPNVAWSELSTLLQLFLIAFFVADYVVQRPAIVRPLLWLYSLSASATALIGVAVLIQGGGSFRAAAFGAQNPAQFAAILLPGLAFGVYEAVNGERKGLGAAIALVTTLGVVVSGTRGAWVAAAVVFLLVILRGLTLRRRIASLMTVLALVLVVYQFPGVSDLLSERAETAISTGGAGRTDIWSVGLNIYETAPVLGVGYANFPVAYTPEIVRESDVEYSRTGRGPHNLVIGTIVELGPLGLLLLALFLAPLLLQTGWGPDARAVQAALISLITLALFLDVVGNRKQVWLVIGLAAGLGYLARRLRGAETDEGPLDALPTEGEPVRAPV
jgi:O-antigen ligase